VLVAISSLIVSIAYSKKREWVDYSDRPHMADQDVIDAFPEMALDE
jgi:hypothetical protein